MSTFLLNPNDTIVMSDSIVAKVTKAADACQMCVNEAATNWADVEIVQQICCSLIQIACIIVVGYVFIKIIDAILTYCSEKTKRQWIVEDRNHKRNADLLDRLLDLQQKRSTPYIVDKDGNWIDKDKNQLKENREIVNAYISMLEEHLTKQDETENKTNS
ncbi:MAG: hypothetical protein J1E57_09550 [Prevotella sp.]|nr:hypothetical protein [Prevotella sp.]